jgi:hypothetical protein
MTRTTLVTAVIVTRHCRLCGNILVPDEDCTCAQCHGPVDGQERWVPLAGGMVWLHPQCQRFYQQPDGEPAQPTPLADTEAKRRHIDEISRMIAAAGLAPVDFFLTQPPRPAQDDEVAYARWQVRERRRKPIAHRMGLYGLTAHDLVPKARASRGQR